MADLNETIAALANVAPPVPAATAPAGTPPASPAAATTTPSGQPLYKGIAGEAKTQDELIEYTKKLENKLLENSFNKPEQQTIQSFQAPVSTTPDPAKVKTAKEQFADMVYTDPEKAFELLENSAVARIDQRDAVKKQEENWWNEFYAENPDLKAADRVVKSVVREKFEEIKKLDLSSAKKVLATESRKFIDGVKSQFGMTTTELPSGPATSFGASQGSPATVSSTPAGKPVSFIDQFKSMRTNRKKA